MPQTMLAALALVMALTYANDVTERRIDFDRDNLRMEVEEMGASVALEMLARIREMPYDDGLKPLEQYKGLDGRLLSGITDDTILGDLATLTASNKRCKNTRGRDPKDLDDWRAWNGDGGDDVERPDRKMGYGNWRDDCMTMNDFNGARTIQIAYPLSGGEVVFDVDIEMTYVVNLDGALVGVATPQLQKQVTVSVSDVWNDGARSGVFLPSPIRISRVFSLEV